MWALLNQYINIGVQWVTDVGGAVLMPILCASFLGAIFVRLIIYYTVKSEAGFALEFEKRVHKYLADPNYAPGISSFHQLAKTLLERTMDEHYNLKRKYRRRRFDQITSLSERLFMIPEGASRVVADTLSQTKYLSKEGQPPRFLDISKFVFESNPVFNRVLGVFPIGMFNDLLNILPGLFVVGGIFGTFLGVMGALPELSRIDINDVEMTKSIMDAFLLKMAFSMGTSIVGIVFSVSLQVLNSIMNPDGIYYNMVNKFTSALEFLWNDTTSNDLGDEELEMPQDRRVVAFTNRRRKEEPVVAPPPAGAAPERPEVQPLSSQVAGYAPTTIPEAPAAKPVETPPPATSADEDFVQRGARSELPGFEEMFDPANTAPVGEVPALDPESSGEARDRLAVLRHRLEVLATYLRKADEDRATGVMSEEMWKDETSLYLEEKERLEAEAREIERRLAA